MEAVLVVVSGAVFLGAGLALGLRLARGARGAAEQERLEALAAELARARALAEQAEARAGEARAEVAALRARGEELRGEAARLAEERAGLASELEAERRAAAARASELERTREQVRAEVEVLAGRLLEARGRALAEQSRAGLEALLAPVAQKLREFEAKVERTYDQEGRDRAALLGSLKGLQEAQARLHADAEGLARALTGESKAQGDWGELVLERVLETAGLTEGREYALQVDHLDEEGGRKRPDALVYLPGDRVVVVDAKCSLTAYVAAMRAAGEEAREAALDAHVASLRAHVKGLAGKGYQAVVKERTLDVVLLFVPNEAAFHAALSRDAALYEEAFRRGVVLCSPTTLLAALQLVAHVWRSERQNQNAQRIAEEAGRLLEKLAAFVEDLDGVGARLRQAQESFDGARAKLATGKGNVLRKAGELMRLGARVRPEKARALAPGPGGEEEGPLEVGALPEGLPALARSGGEPLA